MVNNMRKLCFWGNNDEWYVIVLIISTIGSRKGQEFKFHYETTVLTIHIYKFLDNQLETNHNDQPRWLQTVLGFPELVLGFPKWWNFSTFKILGN